MTKARQNLRKRARQAATLDERIRFAVRSQTKWDEPDEPTTDDERVANKHLGRSLGFAKDRRRAGLARRPVNGDG